MLSFINKIKNSYKVNLLIYYYHKFGVFYIIKLIIEYIKNMSIGFKQLYYMFNSNIAKTYSIHAFNDNYDIKIFTSYNQMPLIIKKDIIYVKKWLVIITKKLFDN